LQNREKRQQNIETVVYLVDIIDAIGDVLKTVHEAIKTLLADAFKNLFALLGSSPRSLKLIGSLYGTNLHVLQPTSK